jgi:hypothetical protein
MLSESGMLEMALPMLDAMLDVLELRLDNGLRDGYVASLGAKALAGERVE